MSTAGKINTRIKEAAGSGRKQMAILIDPDNYDDQKLVTIAGLASKAGVFCFFVGGSLMTSARFESTIRVLKSVSSIPVVIFPGSNLQISPKADAILLLSLISGRNAEYLIGQHVVAAPYLKNSGIEILPTGYLLIESGRLTTANYMSNTLPIPADKPEIAACTAMAGEMLGLGAIYMDGGSGAERSVPAEMVRSVRRAVGLPLIVGGGITTPGQALELWSAGADLIVIGNAVEADSSLITTISAHIHTAA